MEKLVKSEYFKTWKSMLDIDIQKEFAAIEQFKLEPHSFTFYTSVSVMSSSKIEGEQMELDSYVKHKMLNIEYLPELTEKPNDLFESYEFARDNALTKEHFFTAHRIATQHLLPENQRGVLRTGNMLIMEQHTQQVQYEAVMASIVANEFESFWTELSTLLLKDLSVQEVFYYASLIHLVFVKIHPFNDGNGRSGRLLEKWFLNAKLGEKAWYIGSEHYYYKNLQTYYNSLRRVGLFYNELSYEKSIPFLLMLPNALKQD